MEPPDALGPLIERFEQAALHLTGEALQGREHFLRESLRALRLCPAALVQELSDQALVCAFQKGFFSDEAFDQMVARYQDCIWSYLMRLTKNYDLAWDLTQDVWVRVFQTQLRTYEPSEAGPLFYLLAIAWNRCAEWKRAKKNQPPAPLPHDLGRAMPAGTDLEKEEAEAAAKVLAERARAVMVQLPSDQRVVFELIREGKSHAEVAQELGITAAASAGRLFKARQTLAMLLGLSLPPTKRGRPRKNQSPSEFPQTDDPEAPGQEDDNDQAH
jgi:RNA polymerase sigma-70 factor (ECF subfamily)